MGHRTYPFSSPYSPFTFTYPLTKQDKDSHYNIDSLREFNSFTLLSGSPAFLPADASIRNLSAFPKPQRIPGNYANDETT